MDTLPTEQGSRTGPELTADLERLGLPRGGLVMVHSSLRSIGTVARRGGNGGRRLARGARPHGNAGRAHLHRPVPRARLRLRPVGDAGHDRRHPQRGLSAARPHAARIHIVQTVAAIGPLRDDIIDAGGQDGWDAQPSMRAVFDLDGWFLLLGVPYQNLTAGHFMEQEIGTHRRPRVTEGLQRRPDGRVVPLRSETWGPDPNFPGMPERSYDFNRLGEGLEQRGLVRRGAVGNAVARLFRARDLERTARTIFAADPELFFIVDGRVTPLRYGVTWPIPKGRNAGAELCVVDPAGVHQPNDG